MKISEVFRKFLRGFEEYELGKFRRYHSRSLGIYDVTYFNNFEGLKELS
jgi:hypothetical protein